MKKPVNKLLVVALLFVAVMGYTVLSQAGISGSDHDFSNETWSGGQICLPCHAPHNSESVANAPLWNHDVSVASYTLYSSPTLDAQPGQPGGASKLCLSCHDGTVAIDAFGGRKGTDFMSGGALVGTDLSDDHPISFTYDAALATADGGLHNPVTTVSGLSGGGFITGDLLFGNDILSLCYIDTSSGNCQIILNRKFTIIDS